MSRKYRSILEQAKGSRNTLEKTLKQKNDALQKNETYLNEGIVPVQIFFQQTAKETQEKIKIHIEDIVQLALDAVFPDKYIFHVQFETKRGKTEATLLLEQDGETMDPMDSNGGGVVDILALALRISAHTLSRTRNTIILDEPMKFVSRDLQEQAALIIHELAEQIGLQFIISTHFSEIIEVADNLFTVSMKDKRSIVKTTGRLISKQ